MVDESSWNDSDKINGDCTDTMGEISTNKSVSVEGPSPPTTHDSTPNIRRLSEMIQADLPNDAPIESTAEVRKKTKTAGGIARDMNNPQLTTNTRVVGNRPSQTLVIPAKGGDACSTTPEVGQAPEVMVKVTRRKGKLLPETENNRPPSRVTRLPHVPTKNEENNRPPTRAPHVATRKGENNRPPTRVPHVPTKNGKVAETNSTREDIMKSYQIQGLSQIPIQFCSNRSNRHWQAFNPYLVAASSTSVITHEQVTKLEGKLTEMTNDLAFPKEEDISQVLTHFEDDVNNVVIPGQLYYTFIYPGQLYC
jgi:hypothetical protein